MLVLTRRKGIGPHYIFTVDDLQSQTVKGGDPFIVSRLNRMVDPQDTAHIPELKHDQILLGNPNKTGSAIPMAQDNACRISPISLTSRKKNNLIEKSNMDFT